jgi:hypothetical protein
VGLNGKGTTSTRAKGRNLNLGALLLDLGANFDRCVVSWGGAQEGRKRWSSTERRQVNVCEH